VSGRHELSESADSLSFSASADHGAFLSPNHTICAADLSAGDGCDGYPHISPVSAMASQVLPWLRYVSASGTAAQLWSPQCVKNTPAVANLTCLATKGLKTPRDETGEISGLRCWSETISAKTQTRAKACVFTRLIATVRKAALIGIAGHGASHLCFSQCLGR
jgi:hypothetical protein